MKKNYIKPIATEVEVEALNMLAASLGWDGSDGNRVPSSGQLSSGRRGSWGNLWNKQ